MTKTQYRGPLTPIQVKRLIKYLERNGVFRKAYHEKVVFFDTSIFPLIGDFVTGFSRLSLKADAGIVSLRLKEGNPSDLKRKELAIKIKKAECRNIVYILNRLGLQNGYYRPAYRQDFKINKVLVSVKTKCIMGDHFEIIAPGADGNHRLVNELRQKLKLSFWSKRQYQARITALMKKFPAVNVFESDIFQ